MHYAVIKLCKPNGKWMKVPGLSVGHVFLDTCIDVAAASLQMGCVVKGVFAHPLNWNEN